MPAARPAGFTVAVTCGTASAASLEPLVGATCNHFPPDVVEVDAVQSITPDPALITPHSEAFQAVVWHCLVSHPALQIKKTKW